MQLKVQEALARASCVYIMHVLRQHSRPQHERTERTDMFWEIKVTSATKLHTLIPKTLHPGSDAPSRSGVAGDAD